MESGNSGGSAEGYTQTATKWACNCGEEPSETIITIGNEIEDVVCPNCGELMDWYSDGIYEYDSGRYVNR